MKELYTWADLGLSWLLPPQVLRLAKKECNLDVLLRDKQLLMIEVSGVSIIFLSLFYRSHLLDILSQWTEGEVK